jgi:hypothetical protein
MVKNPKRILISLTLLSSSGSLFELSSGKPQLGVPITAAIAALGLPACLFLFYAAVLKAQAETREDDEQFLRKK